MGSNSYTSKRIQVSGYSSTSLQLLEIPTYFMVKKELINVPNFLSLYRLITFPLILYLAFIGQEQAFVVLFIINIATDFFDGIIARRFNMESEFGARLDSIADIGTYILAFVGIYLFKLEELTPHLNSFYIFIAFYIASNLLCLIKFKRTPSLHLYSWKIGGYIQVTFFFLLFVFDFYSYYYYFMIIWGIFAFSEHMIIQLILPEMLSNQKGLYWVLKQRHD